MCHLCSCPVHCICSAGTLPQSNFLSSGATAPCCLSLCFCVCLPHLASWLVEFLEGRCHLCFPQTASTGQRQWQFPTWYPVLFTSSGVPGKWELQVTQATAEPPGSGTQHCLPPKAWLLKSCGLFANFSFSAVSHLYMAKSDQECQYFQQLKIAIAEADRSLGALPPGSLLSAPLAPRSPLASCSVPLPSSSLRCSPAYPFHFPTQEPPLSLGALLEHLFVLPSLLAL